MISFRNSTGGSDSKIFNASLIRQSGYGCADDLGCDEAFQTSTISRTYMYLSICYKSKPKQAKASERRPNRGKFPQEMKRRSLTSPRRHPRLQPPSTQHSFHLSLILSIACCMNISLLFFFLFPVADLLTIERGVCTQAEIERQTPSKSRSQRK